MKEYIKPQVNEEILEIEDIIAVSAVDVANDDSVEIKGVWDIFTK